MTSFLQKLLPGKKLDEITDLDGWRIYYIRLMLLLGILAIPIGSLFSITTYMTEDVYGLIFFNIAIVALMAFVLTYRPGRYLTEIFFLVLYGLTLTFIFTLGPYYARIAWLVMCVVSAAFLFGVRAAIITTVINFLVLMVMYFYAPPYLPAWNAPQQEPLDKWLMFCVNVSLLSLMSGIPVGFLLNRMSSFLEKEQDLSRRLTAESEDLQAINRQLANEIAERVKTEQEIKRLQSELIQAQKMEAMGTLAGGIAHDFNNILSAIIGYGQLVHIDTSQSSRSLQNIEKLLKAGERARALVQQILAFSRKVETVVEPLNLAETVHETLKMMRALIPANVRLQTDLAGPCTVMSSSTYIHQILMNLCTNAIHAMGAQGGILEVALKSECLTERDAKALNLAPGDYARLTVSDSGCGMTPEVTKRIFEPYFTTKGMGSGTGLGLSVVHGIVKSHDGAITCQSAPNEAASFEVLLPQIKAVATRPQHFPEKPNPTGTETILYIDDETMLADMAGQMLRGLGYSVVTQTDSLEALKLFTENTDRFSAVITDMTMPHLTGDQLARKILAMKPGMPIIMCTGYSEHISGDEAAKLGIRSFLMKPYSLSQLAHALREAIGGNQMSENRGTT
jgi:signal transduction histidine kinase/ActR/RegA family two-component response regulator